MNTTLTHLSIRSNPMTEAATLFFICLDSVSSDILGKGTLNLLEKLYIPQISNNDPDLSILKLGYSYLNEAAMNRELNHHLP